MGNNVTSTTVGYWMTELNKRFLGDPEYRKKLMSSPIYKNNPISIKMDINNYWHIDVDWSR